MELTEKAIVAKKVLKFISKSMRHNPRYPAALEIPSSAQPSRRRRSNNASFIIAGMALSFYICWTPYAIRCLLGMAGIVLNARLSGVSIFFSKRLLQVLLQLLFLDWLRKGSNLVNL